MLLPHGTIIAVVDGERFEIHRNTGNEAEPDLAPMDAPKLDEHTITPDELGDSWRDGRIHLDLLVDWNGKRFGAANGGAMEFGFHDLVAHAAGTRSLCAGTVIGSGTVSNANFRDIGSSCIAERRGIEVIDTGAAKTSFMRFGDRVRMEAQLRSGASPFGVIHQEVAPFSKPY